MERREFFRVEDSGGWGIYSSSLVPEVARASGDDPARHPSYQDDSRLVRVIEAVFYRLYCPREWTEANKWRWAFCSLDQMKFWIYQDTWRLNLDELGFRLVHLSAEGLHGDTQGIFLPGTRQDIATYRLMEV